MFFAACALVSLAVFAQEKTLFTMGGEAVSADEFKAVFNKNKEVGQQIDPKTPEEYLDLYINFKLKVKEARDMGLDTLPTFIREFEGYRKQLAKPYLSDRSNDSVMMAEAYARMQEEVRASHIMIQVGLYDLPEDTAKAWKQAMSIKKRLDKGESFEALAKEFSADTYSAERGGDLGYFTVFNMIYPFETAAYQTPVGEITNPVRTQFGYHIIKVTGRRPARGTVQVAHIMFISNDKSSEEQKASAQARAQEVYNQLKSGSDFEELARKFSEDKSSATNGGVLAPFGINAMVPEFEEAAFSLNEVGDYSEPVKTAYGWHIIKLVSKTGIGPYEQVEPELKRSIARDGRGNQGEAVFLANLKKEYNYKENAKNLKPILKAADSTLLAGQWTGGDLKPEKLKKVVLSFADKKYTQADFLAYMLVVSRGPGKVPNINQEIMREFALFCKDSLMAYEERQLPRKYPDYRNLVNEYRDGILLFEITERKVWDKAATDSAGLADYFIANNAKYVWKERADAEIFSFESEAVAKKYLKKIEKGASSEDLEKAVNTKNALALYVRSGKFERGQSEAVDKADWKKKVTMVADGNRTLVIRINEVIPPMEKTLEEVRGLAISGYQKQLEDQWIQDLRAKYPVEINPEVRDATMTELR